MIRVLLVGGGSGGHIYPLLAVAEEFARMQGISVKLSYIGPKNALNQEFVDRDIPVYTVASSKIRRYFSLYNFIDIPKFFWSILQALYKLYILMPDVVFSKGGPGSLAVVLAARFYFIPVLVHESDAVPGLTNKISGRLAQRVAVSFSEAEKYFSKKKVAFTGNPLRAELLEGILDREKAKRKLGFRTDMPLVLVLGGSRGAEQLNNFVLDNLSALIAFTQIIHQSGTEAFSSVATTAHATLRGIGPAVADRYRAIDHMNTGTLRDALCAADIVLSRSGSTIAEIAAFGKPAILVPLESSANDHQRANAYSYAASGAAEVFDGKNFTYHVVELKIKEILEHPEMYEKMSAAAKRFSRLDATQNIANEIIRLTALGK
jgi:UDP-N-acetylglucosamine--N-acetylmuramyl-(pentapeptide) pyrophosphoryl-undecaprenol N-acetylglucosamine transferase